MNASEIIKLLFMLGKMVTINSNLSDDDIDLIAMEYNVMVTKEPSDSEKESQTKRSTNERPGPITAMAMRQA